MDSSYHPLTQKYLHNFFKPTIDIISNINNIESLRKWLFSFITLDILQDYNDDTIELARSSIIFYLTMLFEMEIDDTIDSSLLTPWDFTHYQDGNLIKIFGPSTNTIPITIIMDGIIYKHELSQDMIFGILCVLHDNPKFTIMYDGIAIKLDDLIQRYSTDRDTLYAAYLQIGMIKFDNKEVMRGIATGAMWTNTDPNSYVINLIMYNESSKTSLQILF